jgi:excisionase family DNA binding protein
MPIMSKEKREKRTRPQTVRPPKSVPPDALTISVKQAVAVSSLSRMAIYNLLHSGKLTAHKVGGRTVISLAELKAVLGV